MKRNWVLDIAQWFTNISNLFLLKTMLDHIPSLWEWSQTKRLSDWVPTMEHEQKWYATFKAWLVEPCKTYILSQSLYFLMFWLDSDDPGEMAESLDEGARVPDSLDGEDSFTYQTHFSFTVNLI